MAVSGSEKTRVGASIAGVGKKLTITAKAASAALKGFPHPRGVHAGKMPVRGGKQ